MVLAKHIRLLKYWCGKASCCMGRRRFIEYIGVKLPQKRCKTQSIVQNPRKVTKWNRENFSGMHFFNELEKFRYIGIKCSNIISNR